MEPFYEFVAVVPFALPLCGAAMARIDPGLLLSGWRAVSPARRQVPGSLAGCGTEGAASISPFSVFPAKAGNLRAAAQGHYSSPRTCTSPLSGPSSRLISIVVRMWAWFSRTRLIPFPSCRMSGEVFGVGVPAQCVQHHRGLFRARPGLPAARIPTAGISHCCLRFSATGIRSAARPSSSSIIARYS